MTDGGKHGVYIDKNTTLHLWVRRVGFWRWCHVDIQTTVGRKLYVVWRNDKYEKFSKLCELFENHNFRRTPRNNSSQNRMSNKTHKNRLSKNQQWKNLCCKQNLQAFVGFVFLWTQSLKLQLFLEQKISFFGQKLACLAQVKVRLLTWTGLRVVL